MSAMYRWVACSESEFGPVGRQRHLIRTDARTTVCGHSATHLNIWRGNTTKPICPRCEASEMGRCYPPDGYDDDRPGLMRVHVADARARRMMDLHTIAVLRAEARARNLRIFGVTKHDVAAALAIAGYQPW